MKPFTITPTSVTILDNKARNLADAHRLAYTAGMQATLFKILLPMMNKTATAVRVENILRHSVGLPAAHSSGEWLRPSAQTGVKSRQEIYGALTAHPVLV